MVKAAEETVNVRAFDVLPPGFATVTLAVPVEAMSLAGIAAVNWEALTNVVVRFAPFHLTAELETKFVPSTVNVKAGPPAVKVLGFRLISTGAPAATARVKALVAACGVGCPPSETWTVKLKLPEVEGVPLRTPVEAERASPAGSEPVVMDQLYGGRPPAAARVRE